MNLEKYQEFFTIKERWMELAMTRGAKERIASATFFLSELELRKNMQDTTNGKRMIEKCGNPPLDAMEELEEILGKSTKGTPLTPYELEGVQTALTAVWRLKEYLRHGKNYDNPLAFYDENLDGLEMVREEIFRQIRGGQVDSHASENLLRIRREIDDAEEKMKQKADQVMRSCKEFMADSFSTMRNGRMCVPVRKEYKLRVPGSVIDKSSTGNTLFVEPASVAKVYEELQLLRMEEENEIYQILFYLTTLVGENIEVIRENLRIMEKLDYIFSKAKLSLDLRCVEPQINIEHRIHFCNARHPLMDMTQCVPLNVSMDREQKGIVITGPNTGGKTVAIKTVALNCLMAQCGLHVAAEQAEVCMCSAYLCDIGDGQNLSENLSTFSAHIKNVLDIIGKVNKDSFVIMDELGSGTDPTEGMGIAIAILEELRKRECLFMVTTHYPEVKEYAKRTERIVNARMEFDKNTLSPTYRMVVGEAGESCAFYIAQKLGMPQNMLNTAIAAAYGERGTQKDLFLEENPFDFEKPTENRRIQKIREHKSTVGLTEKYNIGDSVMVFPDKKIGIVCKPVNEKGVLQVQMPDKKIWINHKRVKLHVAAEQLYPEDYDFSIIFDTVENRKARHDMSRKYTEQEIHYDE